MVEAEADYTRLRDAYLAHVVRCARCHRVLVDYFTDCACPRSVNYVCRIRYWSVCEVCTEAACLLAQIEALF